MMEVLQRGAATRLPALAILQAIFEVGPAAPLTPTLHLSSLT